MSTHITPERLAQIDGRLSEATGGCWTAISEPGGLLVVSDKRTIIAVVQSHNAADAVLLAHTREDLQDLGAEVRRLRAAFEHLAAFDWSEGHRFGSAGAGLVAHDVRKFAAATLAGKEPTP